MNILQEGVRFWTWYGTQTSVGIWQCILVLVIYLPNDSCSGLTTYWYLSKLQYSMLWHLNKVILPQKMPIWHNMPWTHPHQGWMHLTGLRKIRNFFLNDLIPLSFRSDNKNKEEWNLLQQKHFKSEQVPSTVTFRSDPTVQQKTQCERAWGNYHKASLGWLAHCIQTGQ